MLAFDIETVPTAAALAMPYPAEDRNPPANYKNEDVIQRWREADQAAWQAARIKECSLNPRLGRIIAIGYADKLQPEGWAQIGGACVDPMQDERLLLTTFWDFVTKANGYLCGWNSHGFDLPFILVRSAIHGITPTVDLTRYLKRYSYTPHFDVKAAVLLWDVKRSGEGLNEWAQALLPDAPTKTASGAEVYGMVQREEWEQLGMYCAQDAALTYALAQKMWPYFGGTL